MVPMTIFQPLSLNSPSICFRGLSLDPCSSRLSFCVVFSSFLSQFNPLPSQHPCPTPFYLFTESNRLYPIPKLPCILPQYPNADKQTLSNNASQLTLTCINGGQQWGSQHKGEGCQFKCFPSPPPRCSSGFPPPPPPKTSFGKSGNTPLLWSSYRWEGPARIPLWTLLNGTHYMYCKYRY